MSVMEGLFTKSEMQVAEKFFKPVKSGAETSTFGKIACDFAELLGVREIYVHVSGADAADYKEFLSNFARNMELVITKTWVDKQEVSCKERLTERISYFVTEMETKKYAQACEDFIIILEELAYLLFGGQSEKEDFGEYTLRIDPLWGLFWSYAKLLRKVNWKGHTKEALLVGMCYLTNF
jgi:hypothetical protein